MPLLSAECGSGLHSPTTSIGYYIMYLSTYRMTFRHDADHF